MIAVDRHREARARAIALVEAELERVRTAGPAHVSALADGGAVDAVHDDIVVTTIIRREGERLLVLAEAWRGRRMLATGGFTMLPDGSTHTPH